MAQPLPKPRVRVPAAAALQEPVQDQDVLLLHGVELGEVLERSVWGSTQGQRPVRGQNPTRRSGQDTALSWATQREAGTVVGATLAARSASMAQPSPRPRVRVPAAAALQEPVQDQDVLLLHGVELGEVLGNGAYGEVRKASVPCAAKILHDVLARTPRFPGRRNERREPRNRFAQECRVLWNCTHPNIVRFYGLSSHPETGRTVLLMELMTETLTAFLEVRHERTDVPYYLQLNISHNIASGIRYLHSRGIIHRDLSSNNVLLLSPPQFTAKISDFGVSLLKDRQKESSMTHTRCPGTPVYMPPEAQRPDSVPAPTEMMDSFQMGVLMLQIATKLFPSPTGFLSPSSTNRDDYKVVPEWKRRESHIEILRKVEHPLLDHPILECLEDREDKRPSADLIVEQLSALMSDKRYLESCEKAGALMSDKRYLESCEKAGVMPQTPAEEENNDKGLRILKETVSALREENESLRDLLEREKEMAERERKRAFADRNRLQQEAQGRQVLHAEQGRVRTLEYELQCLRAQQIGDKDKLQGRERLCTQLQQRMVSVEDENKRLRSQQDTEIRALGQRNDELAQYNSQLVQQLEHQTRLQTARVQECERLKQQLQQQARMEAAARAQENEHLKQQLAHCIGQLQEQIGASTALAKENEQLTKQVERLRANQSSFQEPRCRVVGFPKKPTTVGRSCTIKLEACDLAGNPVLLSQNDPISAFLVGSTPNPVQCAVATHERSFEISFTSTHSGRYSLTVRLGRAKPQEKLAFLCVYPDPKCALAPRAFIGSRERPLKKPCSLAINDRREVLVCEQTGNLVSVFDIANPQRMKRTIGEGRMDQPTGVAVETGNVFVTSRHKLQKFSGETGDLLNEVGHEGQERNDEGGDANDEFRYPHGVTCHRGEVFVADQKNGRVQVFNANLAYLRAVAHGDSNSFNDPSDVAFDEHGRMYVAEYGAGRIQVFSAQQGNEKQGKFLQTIKREECDMKPNSIHVVNDHLYVSDLKRSVVDVFCTSGEFVRSLGCRGYGKGEWYVPQGIASAEGKIFVCGSEDGHVHII